MIAALLVLALACTLAGAAFCAGAETGFTSVPRGRIVHFARAGSAAAKILHRALADRSRTLTGLLVGNNLASVGFSTASAALSTRLFPDAPAACAAWGVVAACVMLCFGEFLPKLFCSSRPLQRMLRLAPCYRVVSLALRPLTSLAVAFTDLLGAGAAPREKLTGADLLVVLRDRKNGVKLTDFESALIARIIVLRMKRRHVTPEALLKALDE